MFFKCFLVVKYYKLMLVEMMKDDLPTSYDQWDFKENQLIIIITYEKVYAFQSCDHIYSAI